MRVSLNIRLDVDAKAWDREYGTGADQASVRADVKAYFDNWLRQSQLAEDGLVTVEQVR
jgi:hypothetical protein